MTSCTVVHMSEYPASLVHATDRVDAAFVGAAGARCGAGRRERLGVAGEIYEICVLRLGNWNHMRCDFCVKSNSCALIIVRIVLVQWSCEMNSIFYSFREGIITMFLSMGWSKSSSWNYGRRLCGGKHKEGVLCDTFFVLEKIFQEPLLAPMNNDRG
jgi:hypothetical protein